MSVSAWRSPKAPRSSKVSESRGKRKGQGRRDEGDLQCLREAIQVVCLLLQLLQNFETTLKVLILRGREPQASHPKV